MDIEQTKKYILSKIEYGFTIDERIHKGYTEWINYPSTDTKYKCPFGKYQYICKSDKGVISLISLPDYHEVGQELWEIYCLEGSLFEDIERFESKEQALNKIKELLC